MMNKHVFFLILLIAVFMCGCSKDAPPQPDPVTVKEIKLDKTTLPLNVGETGQLTATVLPENADDKTVAWKSDDERVATVSKTGLVTAVAEGGATITATAGGKKATCTVTITDPNNITAAFDPEFARVLEEKGYIPDAAHITLADVQDIEAIDVSGTSSNPGPLASLKGIEHFGSLKTLLCDYNQLTSLDVSKNTALRDLYCASNQLTSLDVSGATALIYLDCSSNQLTSLDVSKNTALGSLNCSSNQLTSLDVSKNTALIYLDCSSNQLTSLEVSGATALIYLDCSSNQLTSLDVSKNTALRSLNCSSNQLTSLDVSKNTALEYYLNCENNPGNGSGVFPVTARFGNDAVPADFTTGSWQYNGQLVTIDYQWNVKFSVSLNTVTVGKGAPSIHIGNGIYHVRKSLSATASYSPANSDVNVFFETNMTGKITGTSVTKSSFEVKNINFEYHAPVSPQTTLKIRAVVQYGEKIFYSEWRSYAMSTM